MNVNLYAACPNPDCSHDLKVEPYADEIISTANVRMFRGACDNCGTVETFTVFSALGLSAYFEDVAASVREPVEEKKGSKE